MHENECTFPNTLEILYLWYMSAIFIHFQYEMKRIISFQGLVWSSKAVLLQCKNAHVHVHRRMGRWLWSDRGKSQQTYKKLLLQADTQKRIYQMVASSVLHLLVHSSTLGTLCMLTFAFLIVINLLASEDTSFFTYRLIQHHFYGPGELPVEHKASSLSPAAASEKPFMKVEKK